MNGSLRLMLVSLLALPVVGLANPTIDLKLLQTDQKTAGFLKQALRDSTTSADQVEERMEALIKGRTLTEVAHFTQTFNPEGGRIEFEKDTDHAKVADGEMIPVGIRIEGEALVGPSKLVDFRYSFERAVPGARNRIRTERSNGSSTVPGERWQVLVDWGTEREARLLLARFSDIPLKQHKTVGRVAELRHETELRWCDPFDLKKFAKSTAETRSKAITWLKERSELIGTSGIPMRSGERVQQTDVLEWIHEDGGWTTSELGWALDFQGHVGPQGRSIDVEAEGTFHPWDANRPPSEPEFSYRFASSGESGATFVIEPKTPPKTGPVPVFFTTSTLVQLVEGTPQTSSSSTSQASGITTTRYSVHPSTIRTLAKAARFDPHAVPGMISQPRLQDLLDTLGMNFPPQTMAIFQAGQSLVILRHNAKGHKDFREIMSKHKLTVAPGS